MNEPLSKIRHVVLDMDGTIYLGDTLFPETLPLLRLLRELDIGFTFFTNNNSHSRREYIRMLKRRGINATPENLVTSCDATVLYVREHLPEVLNVFVLGTEGLQDELAEQGYSIVDENPQAVIVGFDRTLTYAKLCQAAYWISQDLPYIATHPDRICPTNEQTVLPDCGAICALLETATGRRPDAIPGKPQPAMLRQVMLRHGLDCSEVALVGDRITTDMQMALNAGVLPILTLTGEATRGEAHLLPESQRPAMIIENLATLSAELVATRSVR